MVKSYTSTTLLGRALLLGTALATIAALLAGFREDAASETETVIVTGTRMSGMKAADSATPIQVVCADALSHVGQVDLLAHCNSKCRRSTCRTADRRRSRRLRAFGGIGGLSPNETLVLVNGKRLHPTGDLQVDGGVFQGRLRARFELIPVTSIDHVEVLQDGAAAQYGTDAVAGVVNIILKSDPDAGLAQGTIGQLYQGDGESYDLSVNKGFALGDKGFLNLTYDRNYQGFTKLGGADDRVTQLNGTVQTGPALRSHDLAGFPHLNRIDGEPRSRCRPTNSTPATTSLRDLHAYASAIRNRFARATKISRPDEFVRRHSRSRHPRLHQYLGMPGDPRFLADGFSLWNRSSRPSFQVDPRHQGNTSGAGTGTCRPPTAAIRRQYLYDQFGQPLAVLATHTTPTQFLRRRLHARPNGPTTSTSTRDWISACIRR